MTLQQFAEKFSGMQVKTIVEILQKEKNSISFPSEEKISLEIDNLVLQHAANQKIMPLPGVVDFLTASNLTTHC